MALGNEQKAIIFEKAAVRSITSSLVKSMSVLSRWSTDVYWMGLMNICNWWIFSARWCTNYVEHRLNTSVRYDEQCDSSLSLSLSFPEINRSSWYSSQRWETFAVLADLVILSPLCDEKVPLPSVISIIGRDDRSEISAAINGVFSSSSLKETSAQQSSRSSSPYGQVRLFIIEEGERKRSHWKDR